MTWRPTLGCQASPLTSYNKRLYIIVGVKLIQHQQILSIIQLPLTIYFPIIRIQVSGHHDFCCNFYLMENYSSLGLTSFHNKTKKLLMTASAPVKIIPENVEFSNIDENQKYEIVVYVRNESSESQRIRVILPTTPPFRLGINNTQMSLAPGLSVRIVVEFHLETNNPVPQNQFFDSFSIIGDTFKSTVKLKAYKPNQTLKIPKIFNMEAISKNRQTKLSIPIENRGKEDLEIGPINCSSPNITVDQHRIIIRKQDTHFLKIRVNWRKVGQINEVIQFPNGSCLKLKGVCVDEKIQIYDQFGKKMQIQDFKIVYIGEKVSIPFYIANNSVGKIQCLAKIFPKNIPDYVDIKIDEEKMAFVSRQNPKVLIDQENRVNTLCQSHRFSVQPYQDYQNYLTLSKEPTAEQLNFFRENIFGEIPNDEGKAFSKQERSEHLFSNSQTLFIKVITVDKPLKVPIKYSFIPPKIKISSSIFEFGTVKPKQSKTVKFFIKNECGKEIPLNFTHNPIFSIECSPTIKSFSKIQVSVLFRPLIAGQYSEKIEGDIFGIWKFSLKAYGQCENTFNQNQKMDQMMNKTLSCRFLAMQRKRRKQKENKSLLNQKIVERTKMGFFRNPDTPLDLAFEACENPKVKEVKKFNIRVHNDGLFLQSNSTRLKKQSSHHSSMNTITNRFNIKDIVKFSEELSLKELSRIEIKQEKLDFGTIFIGSQCCKDLRIANRNNKPIIIELNLNQSEYLSEIKPQPKRIEPLGEAKFTICFKSDHLGQFRSPISYIINKQHIFELDAIANVTLINVEFSARQLKFAFDSSDLCFEKIQHLKVTNQGGTTTKLVILGPENRCFSVLSKRQNQLKPNSSIDIEVAYRPIETNQSGGERIDQDKILFKVIGGAENTIKCSGHVMEPKVNVKEAEIYFPEVFISTEMWGKLTIRNQSKVQSVVKVDFSTVQMMDVFNFQTDIFPIAPEERKQIPFSFVSHEVRTLRGFLNIQIRGGKSLKLPVNINFCFPTVEIAGIDSNQIDIVPVMNNRLDREITLLNKTKTEIKLEACPDETDNEDYTVQFITDREGVQLTYNHSEKKINNGKSSPLKQTISLQDKGFFSTRRLKNETVINKIISLAPNIPTKIRMKFIPKIAKYFELKIPLLLHKSTRRVEPITTLFKCRAVEPLFYLQPFSLNFEQVVISENQFAHKKQIEFVNPHNRRVQWELDEGYTEGNFLLAQNSGVLEPFEQRTIDVYFHPVKEGDYQQKATIFSEKTPQSAVQVQFKGVAVSPKISFNKNMLLLPVVPLSTESKGTVYVENQGFQTVSISKWKIGNTFSNVQFKIEFLDGRLLSLAKKRVAVQISFKASTPTSITTCLEVYDQYGDKIVIPISVTSENCILTNYSYLQIHSAGTVTKDHSDNKLKMQLSHQFSPEARKSKVESCSPLSGNFIKKWCAYELNLHFQNFPESFIESRGELLSLLVNRMSNGKLSLKKLSNDSDESISKMQQLYNFYSEAISVLQGEGAFLNQIRPQYLLNMNDYLSFVMQKNIDIEEEEYQDISRQTWVYLFYQLCKVYVESAITEKFIARLLLNKKQKLQVMKSTIYSEQEMLILRFLNNYLPQDKLMNFNDQARIFQIVQRIIENTFSISLVEELANLKINADSMMLHQFLVIVSKFLHSNLQELGLAMYLQSNDLFTMDHKQFILFFISLMNNLIHYQNSAVVEFECAIDETTRKSIQLENPSKLRKIVYWVKIYGSDGFSSQCKSIQLQKKQKKTLNIGYHCRKNYEEEARLLLVPVQDQDGFIPCHSMSFLLKSKIITKNVMKRIKIRCKLYETKTINIDVELPDGDYTIKMKESEDLLDSEFHNFYLLTEETKSIRGGKQNCEIKIAPLTMRQCRCQVTYISPLYEQYTYEILLKVQIPSTLHQIQLPPMTTEKQQTAKITIPYENQLKSQCMRFHKEILNKIKKKRGQFSLIAKSNRKKVHKPLTFEVNFADQSHFNTQQTEITLDPFTLDKNYLEVQALFPKSYRNYSSLLMLENKQNNDIRVYQINVSVSVKPKLHNIKISTKAREYVRHLIPNKLWPCSFKLSAKLQEVKVEYVPNSTELLVIFQPDWLFKEQLQLLVECSEVFEQSIYKIKLEAVLPDPMLVKDIIGSELFSTPFEIDCSKLGLSSKQLQQLTIRSNICRKNTLKMIGKQKIIKGILQPGETQNNATIKLCSKRSEAFFEIKTHIKNRTCVQLNNYQMKQKIGEVKEYSISGVNILAKDFKYQIEPEAWLKEEISTSPKKQGFYIKFSPTKELEKIKHFKFYVDGEDCLAIVRFQAIKIQGVFLNAIVTENIQKKTVPLLIGNSFEVQGKYQVELTDFGEQGDHNKFKVDCSEFFCKVKDKILLKLTFQPDYIGQQCKALMHLKSETLPELVYVIEGQSKFKCEKQVIEFESKEGLQEKQSINFENKFQDKDRFRFQIQPPESCYRFNRGGHHFVQELACKDKLQVSIFRGQDKNNSPQESKIVISRCKDRKIAKVIQINGISIRRLESQSFNWQCKARQTIYDTISLPEGYTLKELSAEADILKYLSYSTEEKNQSEIKIKFTPMKPMRNRNVTLFILTDHVKFTLPCKVRVIPPDPDDTILIRTTEVKETAISVFKLTNVQRQPAPFTAFLQKNPNQLMVQPLQGILDPYGKPGTPITIRFRSQIHNKRVEDKLIIETNDMYWIFRVIGVQAMNLSYQK